MGFSSEKNKYYITLAYLTFKGDLTTEFLLYDQFTLLSSLGGSLGLFLGMSCLSIADSILRKMHHLIITLKMS
jgi:hypothetical protein